MSACLAIVKSTQLMEERSGIEGVNGMSKVWRRIAMATTRLIEGPSTRTRAQRICMTLIIKWTYQLGCYHLFFRFFCERNRMSKPIKDLPLMRLAAAVICLPKLYHKKIANCKCKMECRYEYVTHVTLEDTLSTDVDIFST